VQVAGSGEPLVLIHGLATTRRIWQAVTPALARRHRVATLDVPGFGESATWTPRVRSRARHAAAKAPRRLRARRPPAAGRSRAR
jgi:pimeloyl-ACP methyl ester carboxylesterase